VASGLRFLDIAVGSAYGALCLSLIVSMSPVASREAAVVAVSQARLDTATSDYIQRVGLPFLASSPFSSICDSSAAASNGTLVIDVLAGGAACIPLPTSPVASSSLTLNLPGRVLVIEAWIARQ